LSRDVVPLPGNGLPHLLTPVPGPRSIELARRLSAVESRNITSLRPTPPIFWAESRGANIRDVDGNIFIDLTAGFGVATAGHANPAVVAAIARQAALLPHALGDVYPAEVKVRLLERLAAVMPAPLGIGILANTGAEAVEAALKTAMLRTHRSGILAFRDSYHGLTYGALATTHRRHFREPFEAQLFDGVRFARFPHANDVSDAAMLEVDTILAAAEQSASPIGAIIVEPIQGRGGIVVPTPDFLGQLRARCDGERRILIFDEVYTGCGRTGRWLAGEHWNVVPDVVVIGKGLSGSLPIAACIGSGEVMSAWPESTGEAIHTSTFLGNPIACAAALDQLDQIETGGLLARARELGTLITDWANNNKLDVRGRGLIQGIVLADANAALEVVRASLSAGIVLLAEGTRSNVLAITPPAVISEGQLRYALGEIGAILSRLSP
jgi:4-aminobutyrate aminotransferase/(S)-3-amino-2-methylpropionate transaminase